MNANLINELVEAVEEGKKQSTDKKDIEASELFIRENKELLNDSKYWEWIPLSK